MLHLSFMRQREGPVRHRALGSLNPRCNHPAHRESAERPRHTSADRSNCLFLSSNHFFISAGDFMSSRILFIASIWS